MVQKLGEYGVSAEKATQILEQYGAQAGVSSAFVEEMTGKVQALGKGFSESSSTIDTSSITVKESIKGIRSVLYDLSVSSSEYAGTYRGVLEVFNNTSGSAANAQDAFNIVYNALKEAGVPLDELNKKLAQEFPSAAQATKSSVDSSIVGITDKTTAAGSQLDDLALVEHLITHTLRTGMAAGRNYKDIYQDCKNRLEAMRYLQCTA